jgi:hypothetical protein
VVPGNAPKAGLDPLGRERYEMTGRVKTSVQAAAVSVDLHEDPIAALERRATRYHVIDGAVIGIAHIAHGQSAA